jgi:hypothetical protein
LALAAAAALAVPLLLHCRFEHHPVVRLLWLWLQLTLLQLLLFLRFYCRVSASAASCCEQQLPVLVLVVAYYHCYLNHQLLIQLTVLLQLRLLFLALLLQWTALRHS